MITITFTAEFKQTLTFTEEEYRDSGAKTPEEFAKFKADALLEDPLGEELVFSGLFTDIVEFKLEQCSENTTVISTKSS